MASVSELREWLWCERELSSTPVSLLDDLQGDEPMFSDKSRRSASDSRALAASQTGPTFAELAVELRPLVHEAAIRAGIQEAFESRGPAAPKARDESKKD